MANIALSALDDHFDQQWKLHMPTEYQRAKRRRNGKANYKIIRYADLCRHRHKSAYLTSTGLPGITRPALMPDAR